MPRKKRIPDKYQIWIDARRRYHLSHIHIQMARELGMNPMRFGKLANEKQEPWKAPLPAFIERLYFKHFGRQHPVDVKSIEEIFRSKEEEKEERQKRKRLRRESEHSDQKGNESDSNLQSPQ